MKNLQVITGRTGSGKSRTLLSKIKKLGEQGKTVFAVGLEYNKEDLIHVKEVDLKLFDSVESMLNYISAEKIETKNVNLIVDNGYININSSNLESLREMNFEQTTISLQMRRTAQPNDKAKEEVAKRISSLWGVEYSGISVEFITNPAQTI